MASSGGSGGSAHNFLLSPTSPQTLQALMATSPDSLGMGSYQQLHPSLGSGGGSQLSHPPLPPQPPPQQQQMSQLSQLAAASPHAAQQLFGATGGSTASAASAVSAVSAASAGVGVSPAAASAGATPNLSLDLSSRLQL